MLLRRQLPLAAAALALACAPSVPQTPAPASVNYAVFDITSAVPQIPLPNDLALQPSSIASFPASAQKDLLTAWAAQGGFPNDQEVDITIDFQKQVIDPNTGAITNAPVDLDVSTITPNTLRIIELPGAAVSFAPVQAGDYVKGTDRGTLTLRNIQVDNSVNPPTTLIGAPWTAGVHYAVAVRGGDSGVKDTAGNNINPSPIFYLLTRGVNLSLPQNETLLPGDRNAKLAAGAQLEMLRQSYLVAFAQVSSYFPATDLAVMGTFQIAPTSSAYVQTDPNRGLIPLPSDFMLDATGAHVQTIAAFGPLAGGIATLDGFSTTGMVLSTTSAPIIGSTVNKNTVFLYDLSGTTPVRVPDGTEAGGGYQSEPSAIEETVSVGGAQTAVSTAIGLQPAIPLASGAMLPPLKENTEYAVLISNGVHDLNQAGLSRSTLAQLLLFEPDHPVAASGKSLVQGVPDATASLVEAIRQKLHPAVAQLLTDKNIPRNELSMAYTFRTQSITGLGNFEDSLAGVPAANQRPPGLLQFAAIPYQAALNQAIVVDPTFNVYDPGDAWTKYGVDVTAVPNGNIGEIIDATITVPELLSAATGAFDPTGTITPTKIKVLIATPSNPALAPLCPGAAGTAGVHCAPLVIFHHGLGGERTNMLAVANELAAKGFIVAAIDMAKHGDRSWCSAANQCAKNADGSAGTCVEITGSATQGDSVPPGICSNGPVKLPDLCDTQACFNAWVGWSLAHPTDPADGATPVSSNYFVSANFFRTRDTIRQDVIDQSALILALARLPVPLLPDIPTANKALQAHLGGEGLAIDPAHVFFEGQSLGAIMGALNAAANPRITRAALNVGGGTLVDILTNSPAFASQLNGLLSSIGITPGSASYLQFLILAKWVIDPADPINAAGHLTGGTAHPMLPDLLSSAAAGSLVLQTPKSVLGQMAACDATVPNPFNLELYGNIGILNLAKLESQQPSTGNVTIFNDLAGSGSCLAGADGISPYAVPHAFITNWGVSSSISSAGVVTGSQDGNISALAKIAQDEAAEFLFDPTQLPPSVVAFPLP